MITLTISDFSCLREAEFALSPINVIIGPQGTGKSVTTKLLYFISDMMTTAVQAAERGETIEEYKKWLSRTFNVWFPPSAWGPSRFNIAYTAGDLNVRILRRLSKGRPSSEVSVTFSDWFVDFYRRAEELFSKERDQEYVDIDTAARVSATLDRSSRLRELVTRNLRALLGDDYLSRQTFIPAGRAFFTSIGRLVAGFEQAGSLDPVTVKFAKLFANIRDIRARRLPPRVDRLGTDFVEKRRQFMSELFGGEIRYDRDAEYVETDDGRKVPFSSLSSGQQELLPMWSLMDYFNELDANRLSSSAIASRQLVYIEEPEAHLFPSAQSRLMEFLIGSVAQERSKRNLILTTHSPYILSKLNVFLKAGQLARRKKRNQDIDDIVPRSCWITRSQLSVYAIEGGAISSLIDDEGLIDGTYLDSISEETSREFSALLAIESEF
jgi:hypothetical protein